MENNEDTVLSMVRARGINLDYLREKLIYIWKQGYSVDMRNTKLVSYDKGITFEPFVDTDMNSFVPTNDGGIVSIDRVLEFPSWTDSSVFLHPFWTKYYISTPTTLVRHMSFADKEEEG